jgi:hypothetical protein
VVEIKTGKLVVELDGWEAWNHSNHGGYGAKWSQDGLILHWEVEGKWTSLVVVIVKMNEGRFVWQKDIVPACWKAILAKTKATNPVAYTREKEENKGNGAAYPEGFTVDVRVDDEESTPLKLPLKVYIDLTSDPKSSRRGIIDSWMNAVLGKDGKLTFGAFKFEKRPGLKNSWSP